MEELVGVLEAFLGLGREAYDHVHADAGVRHQVQDAGDTVGVDLAAVAASHLAENNVVAALQGDVEMGAETIRRPPRSQ